MKRHTISTRGVNEDEDGSEEMGEGKLMPKLGKLKDVSRQVRGDILGARDAVKVQGSRCTSRVLAGFFVPLRTFHWASQNVLNMRTHRHFAVPTRLHQSLPSYIS